MLEILEFLNSVFWLATKFIMGVGFVLYQDFSLAQSIAISVGGGMLGVVVFAYGSQAINKLYRKIRPKKDTPKFGRWNRFLVRLRRTVGLKGIAFLTPVLLTVPVGTVVALTVEKHKPTVFLWMFVSLSIWSIGLSALYFAFDINLQELLHLD